MKYTAYIMSLLIAGSINGSDYTGSDSTPSPQRSSRIEQLSLEAQARLQAQIQQQRELQRLQDRERRLIVMEEQEKTRAAQATQEQQRKAHPAFTEQSGKAFVDPKFVAFTQHVTETYPLLTPPDISLIIAMLQNAHFPKE